MPYHVIRICLLIKNLLGLSDAWGCACVCLCVCWELFIILFIILITTRRNLSESMYKLFIFIQERLFLRFIFRLILRQSIFVFLLIPLIRATILFNECSLYSFLLFFYSLVFSFVLYVEVCFFLLLLFLHKLVTGLYKRYEMHFNT